MASKGKSPKKLEKLQPSSDMGIPKDLVVKPSQVCEGELGVWCKVAIPEDKVYGPFRGVRTYEEEYKNVNMRYAWEVYNLETNKLHHILNATDPSKGNWMRNVNPARYLEEQNIVSIQKGWDIYYRAMKDIEPGEELLTWYSMKKRRRRRHKKDSIELKDPISDPEILQTVAMLEKMESVSEVSGRRRKIPKRFLEEQEFISFKKVKRKLSSEKVNSPENMDIQEPTDEKVFSSEIPKIEQGLKVKDEPMEEEEQVLPTSPNKDLILECEEIFDSTSETEPNELNPPLETVAHTQPSAALPNGGRDISEIMKELNVQPEFGRYQFDIQRVQSELSPKGDKVYRCDICQGIYRHPFSLKRHYLRNHIYCRYLCETDISNCMINVAQQIKSITIAMKGDLQKLNGIVKPREEQIIKTDRLDEETGVVTTEEELVFIPQFLSGVYRCNTCYELFDTLEEIIDHNKEHPIESHKSFACEKCDLKFSYQQNLERHRLTHSTCSKSTGSTLVCHKCGRDFPSELSLNKHLLHHSGRGLIGCKYCPIQCQNVGFLRAHMFREHPEVMKEKARKREELRKNKKGAKSGGEKSANSQGGKKKVSSPVNNKKGGGGLHCRYCSCVCSNLGQMKQHLCREHKEEVSKQMSRKSTANSQLKQAAAKVKAKVAVNKTGFPYSGKLNCKHCGLICKHIGQLRKHMCLVHKDKLKPRRARARDGKLIERTPALKKKAVNFQKLKTSSQSVSSDNKNKPSTVAHKAGWLSCKFCDLKFPHVGAIRQHLCYVHPETVKRTRTPRNSVVKTQHVAPNKKALAEKKEPHKKVAQQKEPQKKSSVICNNGKKKNSEFTFACVICKKRFDTYSNMCRHRTMKHVIGEGMDASIKKSDTSQIDKEKSPDEQTTDSDEMELSDDEFIEMKGPFIAVEDYCPEKVSEFYANVPYNIANNIKNYIDGRPEGLRKFKKYIKVKDYKPMNNIYKTETRNSSESWEKYNFPKRFTYEIKRLGEFCSQQSNLIQVEDCEASPIKCDVSEEMKMMKADYNIELSTETLSTMPTESVGIVDNVSVNDTSNDATTEHNAAVDLSVSKEITVQNGILLSSLTKSTATIVTTENTERSCEGGNKQDMACDQWKMARNDIDPRTGCKIVYSEEDFVITQNNILDSSDSPTSSPRQHDSSFKCNGEMNDIEDSHKPSMNAEIINSNEEFIIMQNTEFDSCDKPIDLSPDTHIKNGEVLGFMNSGQQSGQTINKTNVDQPLDLTKEASCKTSDSEQNFFSRSQAIDLSKKSSPAVKHNDTCDDSLDRRPAKMNSGEQLENDRSDDNRSLPSLDPAPLDGTRSGSSSPRSISPSSVYSQPPDLECQLETFSEDSCTKNDSDQTQSQCQQQIVDDKRSEASLTQPMNLSVDTEITSENCKDTRNDYHPILSHLNLKRKVPGDIDFKGSWYAKRQLFPAISHPVEIPLSPRFSPQPCYDKIKFGNNGEINYVCSVCLKSFKDPDRVGRHQAKWHPSLQCGQINVESGHYIEFLHYMFPTSDGNLSSAENLPGGINTNPSYTCTKCSGTFKNIGRLHIHIVNCDPKGLFKTPVKVEGEVVSSTEIIHKTKLKDFSDTELSNHNKKVLYNQLKTVKKEEAQEKNKKHKNYELLYNPHQHVRRRELIELVDTHQCSGCGIKFKTLSLLERHAKNCTKKEEFSNLKPMISSCINNFPSTTRHVCHYCSKYFTYPKFLLNHYQNFCPVKKEKMNKKTLSAEDEAVELRFRNYMKRQEEVKFSSEKEDNFVEDEQRGWTRVVRKRSRRKNHSWTSIKKKKSSSNVNNDVINTDTENFRSSNSDSQSETDNPETVPSDNLTDQLISHSNNDISGNPTDSDIQNSSPSSIGNITSFSDFKMKDCPDSSDKSEHDFNPSNVIEKDIDPSHHTSVVVPQEQCNSHSHDMSELKNVDAVVGVENSSYFPNIDCVSDLKPCRPKLVINSTSRITPEISMDESCMSDISR